MRTAGTAVAGGQCNGFEGKRGGSLSPSITMMLVNLFNYFSNSASASDRSFFHVQDYL